MQLPAQFVIDAVTQAAQFLDRPGPCPKE
ncbi:hypothetical protein [Mycoplana dimorpha]